MGETTLTSSAPSVAADPLPARPDAVQLRARRSPRLIAIGLLCASLGGLGAAYVYNAVSQSNTVILVADVVPRGDVIVADDLKVVTIGAVPGVSTVPGDRLSGLVGKTALVDLPAGSLLGEGSVGEPMVPAGMVQIGLKLAPGRLPVAKVPGGASVKLVEIPDREQTAAVFAAKVASSRVLLADGQTSVIDVLVEERVAATIGVLAASDRLVLLREADT